MSRRTIVYVALLLAVASALHAKSPAKENWIRVEAPGTLVFSNAKESRAIEVTRQLAQFRSVFGRTLGRSSGDLPQARVFLLKNQSSYDRYGRLSGGGERAYYSGSAFGRFIVVNATPMASTRARATSMQQIDHTFHPNREMFHEYVHYLFDRDRAESPLWLGEGLAEYYSTYETKDGQALIGVPLQGRVATLRSGVWLGPELLFEGTREVSGHPVLANTFYAESWMVVHYLVSGTSQIQRQLDAYAEAVAAGIPHRIAFDASFGFTEQELIEKTKEYFEAGRLPYLALGLTEAEQSIEPRVTPLTAVEALSVVGRLMVLSSPERADAAEEVLREALTLDPDAPGAHFGLALVAEARDESERAAESYRKAVEGAPGDVELLLHFGFNRLGLLPFEPDPNRRRMLSTEARGAFRAAIESDGSSGFAWLGLGQTYLFDDSTPPEAYASLLEARELLPVNGAIPVTTAVLYLRDDEADRADAVLLGALRSYPFPFLDALRDEIFLAATSLAIGPGVHHAELGEIVERLRTISERDPAPVLAKGVDWGPLLVELEDVERHARLFEVSEAIRAGELERAESVVESIAENTGDAAMAEALLAMAQLLGEEESAEE